MQELDQSTHVYRIASWSLKRVLIVINKFSLCSLLSSGLGKISGNYTRKTKKAELLATHKVPRASRRYTQASECIIQTTPIPKFLHVARARNSRDRFCRDETRYFCIVLTRGGSKTWSDTFRIARLSEKDTTSLLLLFFKYLFPTYFVKRSGLHL